MPTMDDAQKSADSGWIKPQEIPMFPLGTVLIPGAVLPLHIFEPRYREMAQFCIDNGSNFGVVLIERGQEVGGEYNYPTRTRCLEANGGLHSTSA